ncbi:IMP-specific 5'-nucleotidase 1 [Cytospora mali]|uniref:IMP-specific 5'-nucleotidase 1 n=1 Tax=Cytospora mali TaxID=578113 RepID=A0A194WA85_CYTMA|nr:IMP-specific 5'-nucleotidase 1 [Valsa mali]
MTTRYRVEYALKTHRRDQFIEWIKGLLAVPFVLHSQPHGVFQSRGTTLSLEHMSEEAARRYAEIMRDVEVMIDDHIILQNEDSPLPSKLKLLVPTVGPFFTRLPLEAAFKYQDRKRYISRRRFVSPSFNDVRLILNSAQSMAVTTYSTLQLATFDGDVTLYDDGQSLEPSSPLVPRLLDLLRKNVRIGIVTAAGYTTADRYYERLHGLLDALAAAPDVSPAQKGNLLVMGGEANYLFAFDAGAGPHLLRHVPRGEWLTPEMEAWSEGDIAALLDDAEAALRECIKGMNLPATLMRKDRAVGIIPDPPNVRIPRESLEETVLVTQKILELSSAGRAKRPHGVFQSRGTTLSLEHMSEEAARRYAEIMRDVEVMIDDHIILQNEDSPLPSKLKLLVPTVGPFFTRLPLEAAFKYQDRKRYISRRRFVSPSFNDVRLILNSAQSMAVTTYSTLQLATFDGDVTLYDDGQSLEPSSPLVPRLLDLLRKNVRIGIVTAAGYTTADRYYERLHGLLDALAAAPDVSPAQKGNLLVMGGEANYLFAFDAGAGPHLLRHVPRGEWLTPEMEAWSEGDIAALLDDAEAALRECIKGMNLPATLMRKDRAVGIIPDPPNVRIPRESLEETVLVTQKILELSSAGRAKRVPFCAFNGGRDVFVDIGDKSWGVTVCQKYFEKQSRASGHGHGHGQVFEIGPENTLHVGDQFLSAGANDFRARSVGTTAWIASPEETVELLDELADLMGKKII